MWNIYTYWYIPKNILIMIAEILAGQHALVRMVDIWKKVKLIMFDIRAWSVFGILIYIA